MFRKIIAQLSYSPSMLTKLSDFSRQLAKRKKTTPITLILVSVVCFGLVVLNIIDSNRQLPASSFSSARQQTPSLNLLPTPATSQSDLAGKAFSIPQLEKIYHFFNVDKNTTLTARTLLDSSLIDGFKLIDVNFTSYSQIINVDKNTTVAVHAIDHSSFKIRDWLWGKTTNSDNFAINLKTGDLLISPEAISQQAAQLENFNSSQNATKFSTAYSDQGSQELTRGKPLQAGEKFNLKIETIQPIVYMDQNYLSIATIDNFSQNELAPINSWLGKNTTFKVAKPSQPAVISLVASSQQNLERHHCSFETASLKHSLPLDCSLHAKLATLVNQLFDFSSESNVDLFTTLTIIVCLTIVVKITVYRLDAKKHLEVKLIRQNINRGIYGN